MIKQLVSFGCSWTYGDELVDPNLDPRYDCHDIENDRYRESHSFPGLIANKHGLDYKCLASPGSSLTSVNWSVINWLENASQTELRESFLLIGLTNEIRTSWYNPGTTGPKTFESNFIHSTELNEHHHQKADEPYLEEWKEFNKLHRMLSECNIVYKNNYGSVTRTLNGISMRNNIPMLQINVLSSIKDLELQTMLNLDPMQSVLLKVQNETGVMLHKENGHPNEDGHKVIADNLYKHIDSILGAHND